ncbi:hypothetical protein ATG66_3761 [Vibrio sp. ES.051]|uniref:hypothetical protein n=1 Tax=Vibrio sp. ES.051 TaxID=1761909 RepID=UPI000C005DE0|nr:hypothetical protein [Vibrio sp. ES.051]PFG45468.1 hypothetical protein ATG66_3761 [Vibrio sp. ES.051]
MLTFLRTIKQWFTDLDEHDRQAKQMRREDRLGETDYQKLQQEVEDKEEEKQRSNLDA